MTWIVDDINALFALYLHKLEQVSPLIVLRWTMIAIIIVALVAAFWGGLAGPMVMWIEEWQRKKRKGAGK